MALIQELPSSYFDSHYHVDVEDSNRLDCRLTWSGVGLLLPGWLQQSDRKTCISIRHWVAVNVIS